MTQREREILKLIESDPMISQERLAELTGITRSSVAVHISNLTKKGYIAGKGYVLRTGEYVAVVGGVNIDIGGRSFSPLAARDSNPGRVTVSFGGVGRNIAHNLRLLGVETRFLTALGDDMYSRRIADSCVELGIDITRANKIRGGSAPTYIYLNDCDGDMAVALSDMEICDKITPSYLAANISVLNNARLVVAEANIPEESLIYLADHCTVPIFADPVSTKKAYKLKTVLDRIHTLKPNRLEAGLLSGIEITDEKSLHAAADALLSTGLTRVFISLGGEGVLAATQDERFICPCAGSNLKNTAGAGDAFTAALIKAYLQGFDLKASCRLASAAAAVNTESDETVNPALSYDTALRKAKTIKIN